MENTKTSIWVVIATFVMVGALILNDQTVSAGCEDQIAALTTHCGKFIQKEGPKIPPSKDCCQVLKGDDVPCTCKYVTPAVEAMISMEKVIYIARTCGVVVKPGMKCGSYTVPPHAT